LIAKAKDLLATAEQDVTEAADETHLRLAVTRLEMFVEHIHGVRERVSGAEPKAEDAPEPAAAPVEEPADGPEAPSEAKTAEKPKPRSRARAKTAE